MNQVYPLEEQNVRRFCGLPVLVVLQDGSRYAGVLTSCGGGKVMLNGHTGEGPEATLAKVSPKTNKKKKNSKHLTDDNSDNTAQTQAYYGEGYGGGWGGGFWGGALLFDLALIAFLFLLI